MPQAGTVELTLYDVAGQAVRVLDQGYREAGTYTLSWDGRDESGRRVATGVYLYQLNAGNFTQTRKMTLLR